MHLLATQSVALENQALEFNQPSASVIFLSHAQSDIECLAQAIKGRKLGKKNTIRAANLSLFNHPMTYDAYCEQTIFASDSVIMRVLGGIEKNEYGILKIADWAKENGKKFAIFHANQPQDLQCQALSTIGKEAWLKIDEYLHWGGVDNFRQALNYWQNKPAQPAKPINNCEFMRAFKPNNPDKILIVIYRAYFQSGTTAPFEALYQECNKLGCNSAIIAISTIKDAMVRQMLKEICLNHGVRVVLSNLSFSADFARDAIFGQAPIIAIPTPSTPYKKWLANPNAISAREIAMNIALPECDGVQSGAAIGFHHAGQLHRQLYWRVNSLKAHQSAIIKIAQLAKNFIILQNTPNEAKKIAIILNNYPNKDGRIANGVGLDTPASLGEILNLLQKNRYICDYQGQNGDELIQLLQSGITHQSQIGREIRHFMPIKYYQKYFNTLSNHTKKTIISRWGRVQDDPYYNKKTRALQLMFTQMGNVILGIQPQRGYELDYNQNYHSPDLPPPHYYLAFYHYISAYFQANAVIHLGKHGNCEWLPGKSVLLSDNCFPNIIMPNLPHYYPFIINDPGEGTQAKRRIHAVILAHLMPPIVQAEAHLNDNHQIEQLVDEYYQAASMDPRRVKEIEKALLAILKNHELFQSLNLGQLNSSAQIAKLDEYLCTLKDMSIRGGLHIYGKTMPQQEFDETLVNLVKYARGDGVGANQSLFRAMAKDKGESGEFDPLAVLNSRLTQDYFQEALQLIQGKISPLGKETALVLKQVAEIIAPNLRACADKEQEYLLQGLNGLFVPAGASGAPTRGKADILPTGHNFYSLDGRAIPTMAAWRLGFHSAYLLLERIMQDTGDYPQSIFISCFGTSAMRNGGDDIAQAMALIGVKPEWDSASLRVIGFEILPLSVLNRPRIMVNLRISGFFRDAFAQIIEIFDQAVRAVMNLDEAHHDNYCKKTYHEKYRWAINQGLNAEQANWQAGLSIFGAKPGNYGTGLQALMDNDAWQKPKDLTDAFLAWGDYGYSGHGMAKKARDSLKQSLIATRIVVQNQDNREHDILDSDDYYQFSGGLARAITDLSGQAPINYHNDHSNIDKPTIRQLSEEIAIVMRARATNPKWIKAMMHHGYKGGFEMAATLDYLYGFAATTSAVHPEYFQLLYDAFILNPEVHEFLTKHNPDALNEMRQKFQSAQNRGFWHPKHNAI